MNPITIKDLEKISAKLKKLKIPSLEKEMTQKQMCREFKRVFGYKLIIETTKGVAQVPDHWIPANPHLKGTFAYEMCNLSL